MPYEKSRIEWAPEPEELRALSPDSEEKLHGTTARRRATRGEPPKVNADVVPDVRIVRMWVWPEREP